MSELVSHIESGAVLTVTVGVADGGGQMLVALNTRVPVRAHHADRIRRRRRIRP